jgi:hypothetical protein
MVRFGDLPEDFQVLLSDMLPSRDFHANTLIETTVLPVNDQQDEWDDLCLPDSLSEPESRVGHWDNSDYKKAAEYVVAMARGDRFPPLVIDAPNALLRDGYHRMYALQRLGVTHYPMICLDQFQ